MTLQPGERVAILGVGYAVPALVRTNTDPAFSWLLAQRPENVDLFIGFEERRVLGEGESLGSLMAEAAARALSMAGIAADEVDLLLDYGSVGEYLEPNALAQVHRDLSLREDAWVLPVASGYTNFLDGLHLARALLESGRARHALVVCGCDWTRRVDYRRAESIGAADGAGAALLSVTSAREPFAVLDTASHTSTEHYGVMSLECRRGHLAIPGTPRAAEAGPIFHLNQGAREAYQGWAMTTPGALCNALLQRQGISGADVTLIAHQSSRNLLDAWAEAIRPAQLLDTLARFGNLTLASIPVTLAACYREIQTRYVVLLGVGIQLQLRALLLGHAR
ncbi:MAG TPA: 3-oxoacyl-[acyl-carrier-protein] synthase III C-terminal domain-containing protein [Thermoanaerobaculia bacterium]|jgi:3-oxoacyl-[acyl-carrier-protein] synthase III|nr:3-oxoacyl-[acyl-carrier-protein] synthase III C-terminal domain-containing protein [Thermoanaerobaculia bacterium]